MHLCCIQSLDEAQLWDMLIVIVLKMNPVCYSLLYNKVNSMYVWVGCYLRSIGGQTHKIIIINEITVITFYQA